MNQSSMRCTLEAKFMWIALEVPSSTPQHFPFKDFSPLRHRKKPFGIHSFQGRVYFLHTVLALTLVAVLVSQGHKTEEAT